MRYLVCIAACWLLASAAHAIDRQKIMDPFLSTVMVRAYRADGGLGYGSGIVIASDKVLTNCHVLRESGKPWISRGKDTYQVESVQADPWHDLCLLHTSPLPFKPVELGESNSLKKGEQVIAIGHSNGVASPLVSAGNIKSLYDLDNGHVIRSTARFALGASGSGLYNEAGQLVGINTFKTIGRQAYYYALPIEWLSQLEKREPQSHFPLIGQALWEASEQSRLYFLLIAIPELQEDWQALGRIAAQWTAAEPDNSEAWYELGLAQEHLQQSEAAEISYKQALILDPENTDAMFRLGLIASRQGNKEAAYAMEQSLSKISEKLAMEFRKAAACPTGCNDANTPPASTAQ
ncbi:trypsin-like peptidase domain-containing protein [Methylobacillus arboreus]|uniref:S1 family peptidase n=1 Tax=Methylobacillus arboreus TaxID=755170 RepID=UPI001E598482|nr:serine protease [Methylobacillus arboreus]MCB5189915.1 trypsin-like peptidase domain-containing protein [Methylobacillus arboreus]